MNGHELPADAPSPPGGCEWRHSSALRVGDRIYAGEHDLFGIRQPVYMRIVTLDEKPKTYAATTTPTHPRLFGTQRRRFSKDEWLAVLSDD